MQNQEFFQEEENDERWVAGAAVQLHSVPATCRTCTAAAGLAVALLPACICWRATTWFTNGITGILAAATRQRASQRIASMPTSTNR